MSVRNRILGPPVPKMPSGLVELMDGLARDVLKNNPENIYDFCARHMQTLLQIRDGREIKPLLTLEQKIEKAQKKINRRAEERRRTYDKLMNEEINKQQSSSANDPSRCDDSKLSEKIQSEVFEDVKAEETIVTEEQVLEEPATTLSVLENETIKNPDISNNVDFQDISENQYDKITNIQPTDTDSDKKEIGSPSTEEVKAKDTITDGTDNIVDDNMENIISGKDDSKIASENDFINDNVIKSLPVETATKFEESNNNEDKIISLENHDTPMLNERTEIIEKYDEKVNEVKTDNVQDMKDEIYSNGTKSEVALPSENNHLDNSPSGINTENNGEQSDNSPIENSSNETATENILNAETDSMPIKKEESLNEPEKSGDDQILNVILSSNNDERISLRENISGNGQAKELDSGDVVEPESSQNESVPKSEHSMVVDTQSAHDSIYNNDKTSNTQGSMDLETAAITIQKVFRSFLFKTKTASYDDPTTVDITLLTEDNEKEDNDVLNTKDRRHLGISRMDTVLQTVNEEKSLSLSTDDSSTLSSAATIIQAHVRGFLVRNKMNLNKTISSNSLIDSDAPSIPSLEADSDNIKSKTILNIHIVPEGGHYVSRDESILTSMDLSLDSSPPSSVNLHPLGYDKSERRKQLKREDAIQSVSPPSNNSGKLSEEHDSVKEVLIIENNEPRGQITLCDTISVEAPNNLEKDETKNSTEIDRNIENPTVDATSDEMDVVTPFLEGRNSRESENSTKLLHSGEFHDIVVPTNVTRSDTSIVRGE